MDVIGIFNSFWIVIDFFCVICEQTYAITRELWLQIVLFTVNGDYGVHVMLS